MENYNCLFLFCYLIVFNCVCVRACYKIYLFCCLYFILLPVVAVSFVTCIVDSPWMLKRSLSMYHVTSVFGFHRHGCPPTVLRLPQSISVHVCQARTLGASHVCSRDITPQAENRGPSMGVISMPKHICVLLQGWVKNYKVMLKLKSASSLFWGSSTRHHISLN